MMKIIEGLKELKLIDKKIQGNIEKLRSISSYVSTDTPEYGSEKEQRAKVWSLIQSNNDLVQYYLDIKSGIDYTNLMTMVTIEGDTRSIHDWIIFRTFLGGRAESTYRHLSSEAAVGQLKRLGSVDPVNPPKSILCFDVEERDKQLEKISNILGKIDSTLEVVNATTDLMECPKAN